MPPTVPQLRVRSFRRACDFSPNRPCGDTLYAPFYFADPSPAIAGRAEVLYLMGGHLDDAQTPGLSSPGRFADKIYLSPPQADGSFGSPVQIIGKSLFPWMSSDVFLAAHPEAFVGSTAGPSVFKIGNTYHMIFCASVKDPNICTGEHSPPSTLHGSCIDPWSYFALFWATSADGQNWTLRDMGRSNPNVALQHAAAYYDPSVAETVSGSFKGIAMAHAVADGGFVYIFFEFWSSLGQRNGLLRTAADDLNQFDIWNGGNWDPLTDGALPSWFNGDIWRGNPFALIINHVTLTSQPGFKYVLTAQGSGISRGGSGFNNCIEVAFSNDLTNWTEAQMVGSDRPRVADGTGSDNSVINPIYFEDGFGYHFLYATNDYNLDGASDCGSPYPGLAIFQADPTLQNVATIIARRRAVRHSGEFGGGGQIPG
jgi:hypothetical protein